MELLVKSLPRALISAAKVNSRLTGIVLSPENQLVNAVLAYVKIDETAFPPAQHPLYPVKMP